MSLLSIRLRDTFAYSTADFETCCPKSGSGVSKLFSLPPVERRHCRQVASAPCFCHTKKAAGRVMVDVATVGAVELRWRFHTLVFTLPLCLIP
jgi:hypothetical protein